MSIWNWIGASPEITDSIPEISESISLVRKMQNSELTPEQRNKVLKNSCNLKVIFSNARLRASVISQIPKDIIDSYPAIKKAVQLHYQIGSETPSNHQLTEFVSCLGANIDKPLDASNCCDLPTVTDSPSYSLYEYQNVVVNKSNSLLLSGAKRFLIHMPTHWQTRTAMALSPMAKFFKGLFGRLIAVN